MLDEKGEASSAVGTLQDISERRDAEEKIRLLAHFDTLTGLPNRQLFTERLGVAVAQSERHGRMTGILFLDLDRFKRGRSTQKRPRSSRALGETSSSSFSRS